MQADVQRWVQRNGWDRAAAHYEQYWESQLRPAHDALVAFAALQPGERVIDVGCGTGLVTIRAAQLVGHTGSVVGVDVSAKMIDRASRMATAESLTNITFALSDAESLGELSGFDVALCSLGLMYVPDPRRALTEMCRVVRPGGRIVVAVWGERRRCGWSGVFPIVDARVVSDVCPMFFALGTPGALRAAMELAGAEDVRETRIEPPLLYDDDATAIGAAFAGGPVALAYGRFDKPTREAVGVEYLDSISAFRVGDGYRVPAEFVVAVGARP